MRPMGDTCGSSGPRDRTGTFTLYAQLLEQEDDGEPGNAVDTVQVRVGDAPPPATHEDDGCAVHSGSPAPVAWHLLPALVLLLYRQRRRNAARRWQTRRPE